jgi:hypothetical protein
VPYYDTLVDGHLKVFPVTILLRHRLRTEMEDGIQHNDLAVSCNTELIWTCQKQRCDALLVVDSLYALQSSWLTSQNAYPFCI